MTCDSNTIDNPAPSASEGTEFTCGKCGTPDHLIIESLQALDPDLDGWVSVDYSCGACGSFFAHDVAVTCLTGLISDLESPLGVAEVGQQYVHCGEPMQEGDMDVTGIADTQSQENHILEVQLPTVVLRCRCGFQMSIPR